MRKSLFVFFSGSLLFIRAPVRKLPLCFEILQEGDAISFGFQWGFKDTDETSKCCDMFFFFESVEKAMFPPLLQTPRQTQCSEELWERKTSENIFMISQWHPHSLITIPSLSDFMTFIFSLDNELGGGGKEDGFDVSCHHHRSRPEPVINLFHKQHLSYRI